MKMDTFKRSVVGGIIALLLVSITLPTPTAQAASLAELQAQIQSLLVQITALQNQLRAMQGETGVCVAPTSNLTLGNSGNEVVTLQKFLISRNYVIPAGATGYFGSQTQQALQQFQAAEGISPALGYNFGPQTRARIQSHCAVKPTPTPTPTPDPKPTPEPGLSGEASFERFEVKDGDDTDLEEGDKESEVMEVSFRVIDGDAKINRIDLGFRPDGANNEKDPWDTFAKVSVWSGTNLIGEIDASREKNWKEDSPSNGDYLLRMSNLSLTVREDKDVNLTVKVDTQKSVKGTSDGEIWNIFVPDEGIRALDADKAALYTGDAADSVTLNLDEKGSSDELIVRRSDEDPDSNTLQLKDDGRSGYIEVFAFDLDTDDSKNDIDIRNLPIELTVSNATLETFMRNVRLVVDGDVYTDESVVDGSTGVVTFEFDRGEFTIDAGDRITVMVEIDFNSLDEIYEGTTIVGHIDADDVEAEGEDDLSSTQLQGAATGEVHTFYSKGTAVASDNATAVVTTTSGPNNDYVTFSIKVNVNAFGQDVYVPFGTTGVTYKLVDSVGSALSASGTAVVSSSADETGNYFRIDEGNSETITLDVTYLPGVPNTNARLQLISINYSDSAQPPTQSWLAQPASSYRTPVRIIVN